MTSHRWQFSIRGLLFLTAILSAFLAFAVRMPAFFKVVLIAAVPICVVVGVLQGANFATSDRRPRMSLLAWSLLGLFFALYTLALFQTLFEIDDRSHALPPTLLGISVMGGSLVVCVFRAYRSYTLINGPTEVSDDDLKRS